MKEAEMKKVAAWIDEAIQHASDEKYLKNMHKTITAFTKDFPLPN
jgi:glycine hydroxymethyltransferase